MLSAKSRRIKKQSSNVVGKKIHDQSATAKPYKENQTKKTLQNGVPKVDNRQDYQHIYQGREHQYKLKIE